MKNKNNGSFEKEIKRIEAEMLSQVSDIATLKALKEKDHYESECGELFIFNNSIKQGKLRIINSWRSEGMVVCDKVSYIGSYKVYEDCALLYSISKTHRYDPNKRSWDSITDGFINKDCPDYFNFFNRNNATLRRGLNNFSKTQLCKDNSSEIPSWLQDYIILM